MGKAPNGRQDVCGLRRLQKDANLTAGGEVEEAEKIRVFICIQSPVGNYWKAVHQIRHGWILIRKNGLQLH